MTHLHGVHIWLPCNTGTNNQMLSKSESWADGCFCTGLPHFHFHTWTIRAWTCNLPTLAPTPPNPLSSCATGSDSPLCHCCWICPYEYCWHHWKARAHARRQSNELFLSSLKVSLNTTIFVSAYTRSDLLCHGKFGLIYIGLVQSIFKFIDAEHCLLFVYFNCQLLLFLIFTPFS